MTAAAAVTSISIERADEAVPVIVATGQDAIAIRPGTSVTIGNRRFTFDEVTPIVVSDDLEPGEDYVVGIGTGGKPFACLCTKENPMAMSDTIAGFHYALSGNAEACAGGDGVPAINPCSLWDRDFRPDCPDPRGMTLVEMMAGRRFWSDIYLLGVDHNTDGTSRCGVTIADGRDRPIDPSTGKPFPKLDYATAASVLAFHGKRPLGAEEFFTAAYGVKERCSRDEDPVRTGVMRDDGKRFVSRFGLIDATGTMWQWGTDGHPDDPRPSIFGGSWFGGSDAGSRFANLGCWPELSNDDFGVRGAGDHLSPARAKARAA